MPVFFTDMQKTHAQELQASAAKMRAHVKPHSATTAHSMPAPKRVDTVQSTAAKAHTVKTIGSAQNRRSLDTAIANKVTAKQDSEAAKIRSLASKASSTGTNKAGGGGFASFSTFAKKAVSGATTSAHSAASGASTATNLQTKTAAIMSALSTTHKK